MGNCIALCKPNTKSRKILRIVKMDGEMLELTSPISVKELLAKFSGFYVAMAKTASRHLPPNYEMKMGKIYYLVPCPVSTVVSTLHASSEVETEQGDSVKRIKVVITKQQLQELLKKQISVEDVLSGLDMRTCSSSSSVDSASRCWKPRLEPIPEGSE